MRYLKQYCVEQLLDYFVIHCSILKKLGLLEKNVEKISTAVKACYFLTEPKSDKGIYIYRKNGIAATS